MFQLEFIGCNSFKKKYLIDSKLYSGVKTVDDSNLYLDHKGIFLVPLVR